MKNFSGLTITGATSDGYSVKANGYVKGSWLQSSVMQNYGSNTGKVCVFDNSGWIYYRTPAEILAEAGGGASTEVVQTTGTSTTAVMSQKATTDELAKKANLSGGNTFTGKQLFNNTVNGVTNQLALNETQWDIFTCRDLTTPAMKTAIGKGFVWCQDSDAIYSQFKATGIYYGNDNNGSDCNLLFPEIPNEQSLEKTIATTDQIPDVSGKANLSGTNNFTGSNTFTDNNVAFISQNGQTSINGSNVSIQAVGAMGSAEFSVKTDNNNKVFEVISDADNGAIYLNRVINIDNEQQGNVPLLIGGTNAGTSGQVLTSQGAGETPTWTTPAIKSASLSGTTLTITL